MASTRLEEDALLAHLAHFYTDVEGYASAVATFVEDGLAAGEPVFVAVPGSQAAVLRGRLNGHQARVRFADMSEVGRNPAAIIPAIRAFTDAHRGQRTRFVGEPIWNGRTPAETREATLHEALLNETFADVAVSILCPYDMARLDPSVIADAKRTHPSLDGQHQHQHQPGYGGPAVAAAIFGEAPPPAPEDAQGFQIRPMSLAALRRAVAGHAQRAGLSASRTEEFVVAVNEVVTNTLVHAEGEGTLRIWPNDGDLVCEISDQGLIAGPLAGRSMPPAGAEEGRGLLIANQLCDLVEVRSGSWGANVRLHVVLGGARQS